jgi:hypothetical protein
MSTSRLETEQHLDAIVNRSRALWRALGAPDLFPLGEDAEALKVLAMEIEDHAAAARNAFEGHAEAAGGPSNWRKHLVFFAHNRRRRPLRFGFFAR